MYFQVLLTEKQAPGTQQQAGILSTPSSPPTVWKEWQEQRR